MADKNITFRQKNTSGAYDKLYTKTTATQSKLSTETAALFGDGTSDADAALAKIADTVKSIGNVQVKVVDPSGNPIQGARITGLYGTPTTASDGTAHGVLQTNPISISSPYIDLKDQTVDASTYAGSFNVLTITLPIVGENAITRITSSKTVKFSKVVKSVDVCCVGGGGGGGVTTTPESGSYGYASGGGGGAINNSYGISVTYNQPYSIVVASGAAAYSGDQEHQTRGGTTTAFGISSQGGYSAYHLGSPNYDKKAGLAAMAGCGDGAQYGNGNSNNTISEFNDGVTFYSGGGASGTFRGGQSVFTGGSPNGANGAHAEYMNVINASQAGIGGGGGGGSSYYAAGREYKGNASAGGSGLVSIRFHF